MKLERKGDRLCDDMEKILDEYYTYVEVIRLYNTQTTHKTLQGCSPRFTGIRYYIILCNILSGLVEVAG